MKIMCVAQIEKDLGSDGLPSDTLEFGMKHYNFYRCHKCTTIYFGGKRECGDAEPVCTSQKNKINRNKIKIEKKKKTRKIRKKTRKIRKKKRRRGVKFSLLIMWFFIFLGSYGKNVVWWLQRVQPTWR
jgi:hypothetical protein